MLIFNMEGLTLQENMDVMLYFTNRTINTIAGEIRYVSEIDTRQRIRKMLNSILMFYDNANMNDMHDMFILFKMACDLEKLIQICI